jgi:hypothetical protein
LLPVVLKPKKIEISSLEKIKKKIKTAKNALSKTQDELDRWKSVADLYNQLFRKHMRPELERLHKVRKSWVLKLYEARNTMKWSRNEKDLLDEEIVTKAIELLDEMPGDSDLEAVINKYQEAAKNSSIEEDFEPLDESFLEMLAADLCAESNLPKDFFKGCKNEKEMYDRFTQHMDERSESRRAEAKPSGKQFASGVIKSLYRRLASLVHPDKESDPTLKRNKTELMQRLNTAYKHNDIDELMKIQLEIDFDRPVDLMSDIDGLTANLKSIKKQHKDLTMEVVEIKNWLKAAISPDLQIEDAGKIEPKIRNSFKNHAKSIKQEIIQLESDINYTFKDRKGIKNMMF